MGIAMIDSAFLGTICAKIAKLYRTRRARPNADGDKASEPRNFGFCCIYPV